MGEKKVSELPNFLGKLLERLNTIEVRGEENIDSLQFCIKLTTALVKALDKARNKQGGIPDATVLNDASSNPE